MTESTFELCNGLRFTPVHRNSVARYIVEDTLTGRFLRIGRREYLLAAAMNGRRSMSESIAVAKASMPDANWAPEFVENCLKWLMQQKVVRPVASNPPSAQESQSAAANPAPAQTPPTAPLKLFDPFSFKIKLFNGSTIERWLTPAARHVHAWMAIVAVMIMIVAAVMLAANFVSFTTMAATLFVPESKLWWLAAWLVLKCVHELGHATLSIRFGGGVRQAGITFFCFAPIPYVDVSDIWRCAKTRERMLCTMGGVLAEAVVAGLAVIVGCTTSSPTLQYFCVTIATLGTITTVAFNANPLMRFDGYFVLSDLLDRPTLWQDAQLALSSRCKWLLSMGRSPIVNSVGLAVYGISTTIYRLLMLVGLAWGAIAVWQGVGMAMVGLAAYLWFVVPQIRKRQQSQAPSMMAGPATSRSFLGRLNSWRPQLVGLAALPLLVGASNWLPSPVVRYAPGVVAYRSQSEIRPQVEGLVEAFLAGNGDRVEAGQPIARLVNPTLKLELAQKQIELETAQEHSQALSAQHKMAEMQAALSRVESLRRQTELLQKQVDGLIVRSTGNGTFRSGVVGHALGQSVNPSNVLGVVVQDDQIEVQVLVSQRDIDPWIDFASQDSDHSNEIRIAMESGRVIGGQVAEVLPQASDTITNPIFAAMYGGPIAVRQEAVKGREDRLVASAARFTVKVSMAASDAASLSVGQRCRCRLANHRESIFGFVQTWFADFCQRMNARSAG